MSEYENTILWEEFYKKANDQQRNMVRNLVEKASQRLDRIIETFPTYTLHNRTHALNVLNLMGKLLGPDIEKITVLEGAILILSAYLHDIGMIFTEDERQKIGEEAHFEEFLNNFAEARLCFNEDGITDELAEWYCRWCHADRVYNFLQDLSDDEIKWGVSPLREQIGNICRSHYDDVEQLSNNTKFPTDFRGEADLRFCAILLRLADILDFDNSRAPEEVYKYLGLDRRRDKRETISDVEWRTHLNSDGFRFIRDNRYGLKLIACPDHPAIEYDIREFLKTIENEIRQCDPILKQCSDKWRDFRLPDSIDCTGIQSNGYKYGEFRFSLEKKQVLDLFIGENLYDNPYVFVRELLQNAIDTTRYRVYYERSKGKHDYQPQPIVVSTWWDEDIYRWVRIDDYGMGMNEDIILNYFLKVGQSYYQSPQFKVNKLSFKEHGQPDFTPISRFGIGILSCFIAGDQVEVSTRYIGDQAHQADSIRLSLSGLHEFYIFRTENERHKVEPMPNQDKTQETYRKRNDFGTSIAVRLDSGKVHSNFNLKELLERYISCSPVPILFKGELMGGNPEIVIEKLWIDGIIDEVLTEDELARIQRTLGFEFSESPKIRLIPLDLTKHSPTRELQGQALLCYLSISQEDKDKLRQALKEISYHIHFLIEGFVPTIKVKYHAQDEQTTLGAEVISGLRELQKIMENCKTSLPEKAVLNEFLSRTTKELSTYTTRDLLQPIYALNNIWVTNEEYVKKLVEQECKEDSKAKECFENMLERLHYLLRLKNKITNLERKTQIRLKRISEKLPSEIREHPHYIDYWLSHNGIIVPRRKYDAPPSPFPEDKSSMLTLKNPFEKILSDKYSGMIQYIALRDSLRPDVSLARDQLRELSWNIYSAITLAFARAIRANPEEVIPDYHLNIFDRIFEKENFLLGTVLNDPLLPYPYDDSKENTWFDEPIIETNHGKLSLKEIKRLLAAGTSFEICMSNLLQVNQIFRHQSIEFMKCCVTTLVQIGLQVRLLIEEGVNHFNSKYIVDSSDLPLVEEGQMLFPPLFFVPYENSDKLKIGNCPLNQNHPFSQRLIQNAPMVNEKYPGIFDYIRKTICSPQSREQIVQGINNTLERLRKLDEQIKPETGMNLKEEDF